jgi:hypothetical protein
MRLAARSPAIIPAKMTQQPAMLAVDLTFFIVALCRLDASDCAFERLPEYLRPFRPNRMTAERSSNLVGNST